MPTNTPIVFAVDDPRYAPTRANDHDAGFDLRACLQSGPILLDPGERSVVPTGSYVALEPGYAGLVCPRSGNAAKLGLTVLNAPGIIDSGYRGEIGVILHNASDSDVVIIDGMRIAQLVVHRIETVHEVVPLADLPAASDDRSEGGFGSTGH